MEQPALPSQDRNLRSTDTLNFSCQDTLPCFTQCCRDVNIYLTPYDVLRLRRALRMKSSEFLARYTRHFLEKSTGLPIVQLLMDSETLFCKLVSPSGCTVYHDRPWACRMFPLDLTGKEGEYRLIAKGDRCLGLKERNSWTVQDWLVSQNVEEYLIMEQAFREIMPASYRPGSNLGAGLGKVIYLAYDLDRLEELFEDKRIRDLYEINDNLFQKIRKDDEALLRLAFRYIRTQLEEFFALLQQG